MNAGVLALYDWRIMQFDLRQRTAIGLVLDMQTLFTGAAGPFENPAAGELVGAVNALTATLREREIEIVFSSYCLQADLSDAGLLRSIPLVQQGYFSCDSPWTSLDAGLVTEARDHHLARARPNAFFGGELRRCLAARGADLLVLAGLSVNNAISATARAAFEYDLPVLIPQWCVGAAPWEDDTAIYFDILDQWTAQVVGNAAELDALLDSCGQ